VCGAEAVVHLAALHAPHVGLVPGAEFQTVNVSVTEALLTEAVRGSVSRFVYCSSTSVYGHSLVANGHTVWVDEDLPPHPRDSYDETKLSAEDLVAASPVRSLVLRVARCFPEPLPVLARHRLHRGVDPSDVAAAHILALTKSHVTGILNIAGPLLFDQSDLPELSHSAAAVVRRRAPAVARAFARRGWPLPHQLDRVYDSRAACRQLGNEPTMGVLDLSATG
jgi:nucleoside-diphosphate-sugar epimerase